jgi:SAM-dependent methyltransferase
MLSDPKHNPLGRFDGLAAVYARARPGYPPQAVDWIVELLPRSGASVVDVGCGTGISSRLLAERGVNVIGIEPNESMRIGAIAAGGGIDYRAGSAEVTGLPSECADGVIAAQAFHWFTADVALREFRRLLRPGGGATLLWNDFDPNDPFTSGYVALQRRFTPEPDVIERPHHLAGEALLTHPGFTDARARTTPNAQELDEETFQARAFSASFAPKECGAARRFAEQLRQHFEAFAVAGRVRLRYRTVLYQARRDG